MARTLRSPLHVAMMIVLRRERSLKGFTQTELAEKMNRPQSFVAKVEVGERRLDVVEFVEYADALGTSPTGLLQMVLDARES